MGPVDRRRRSDHLWTTLAEHVFDVVEAATTRRTVWSNPVMSLPGRHRPLSQRGPVTPATLLPGLVVLRRYRRAWLRGDLVAGVTVAAYLVPQVMAYAQIAGGTASAK